MNMIKILNRGFISVTPKPFFYEEAAKEMNKEILTFINAEPTIYLIEEDFWDNETVLKKHFKKIIASEKRQLNPSHNLTLDQINIENAEDYFIFRFGNLVIDNEDSGIESTKDDLSN
ncbi:MAG: hypothetical protein CL857_04065 [Cryomorphaceae bacterium]|nr:hypothetical protein [Cryomorphaceae bacterium]